MNIKPKSTVPEKPKYQPPQISQAQRELHEENLQAIVPHGKWKDKLLGELKEQDNRYYKWLVEEDLIYGWGMIKLRADAMIVNIRTNYFTASNGERWISLQEYPGPGIKCPDSWLYE